MTWNNDDRAKFENDLIHNRLTWLGVFEGLLFVAYARGEHQILLPLTGLAIAVSIAIGIAASNRELSKLHSQAHKSSFLNWLMPGTAIPVIIGIAWIVLLGERIFTRRG